MKYEDAKRLLITIQKCFANRNEIGVEEIAKHFGYCKEIELIIEAVDKQVPNKPFKKVIEYPYSKDLEIAQCPSCNRRLRTGKAGVRDSYCPDCGQKIDWSDEL